MKRFFFLLLLAIMGLVSCDDSIEENIPNEEFSALNKENKKRCFTMEKLEDNLSKDKNLSSKMSVIEEHTMNFIKKGNFKRLANGAIQIPVVFHVIYRSSSENLDLSVLQGQIDALNEDFNLQNPNRGALPSEFSSVEANAEISFTIQQVIRVQNTKKRRWRPNDDMKYTSKGGSDAVNPQEFLNFWIVNSMPYKKGQVLGYAQFPGGNRATDGIVVAKNFVGPRARTATHEVGHYLNLRHIWGDGGCGASDYVDDTPDADGPSRGCPSYPTAECGSNNMTMNFMDYSDDSCMYMFTTGQSNRMDAVFASGGFREAMAN